MMQKAGCAVLSRPTALRRALYDYVKWYPSPHVSAYSQESSTWVRTASLTAWTLR